MDITDFLNQVGLSLASLVTCYKIGDDNWEVISTNMERIYELCHAAGLGYINKVKHLIEQGVPVNGTERNGWSPLHHASQQYGHTDVVKLLLEFGAKPNLQSQDGRSPLHYASNYGRSDVVKLLLKFGAKPNLQSHHGESPLHFASRKGHSDVVKLLLDFGGNPNLQNHNKRTPLHYACKEYYPSDQKSIDICVILIESGADHKIIDGDGKTPVDVLGTRRYGSGRQAIDIRSDRARPIRKAIERRDYSLLLEETVPVKVAKIFLVGDPEAGKSTIKRTLTTSTKPIQPYIPTPGIDVGTYQVGDIGDVSIWDSAGHLEYHVTHGLLLGNQNAVAVVVYDINKPDSYTRLCYWLRFLKSGHRESAEGKLKIVIVATHLDTFDSKTHAFELAKKNLSEIRAFFGETLDISTELHVMNAHEAESEEMVQFRMTLRDVTTEIKGARRLPKLCEAILTHKSTWVNPNSPVLSFEDYVARVKEVDPLVSPKIVRVSANYLQDMGEIFLAKRDDTITFVVLIINWLAYNIIGPALGGDAFTGHFEQLLEPKFSYSRGELESFFKGVDDFSLLSQLLQALELMATFDGRTFIIPAKIPSTGSSTSTRLEIKKGRTVFSADSKSMVSPTVFGTIQIRIMELFKSRGNRPRVLRESLQFGNQTISLMEDVGERDAINFAVEHSDGDAESCFEDLEKMTNIIVTTLYGLSPGTTIAIGYLSPRSIQQSPTLKSVQYYTMDELEAGEARNRPVYHKTLHIGEKTTDVLIAGGDPYFLRKNGLRCDYQWMLETPRNALFQLLDSRKEYRLLAQILNIDATELATIEKSCEETTKSCTESVLNLWRATSRQRMTLEKLSQMLRDPNMIGNAEAADIIDDMLTQQGQQVVRAAPEPTIRDPESDSEIMEQETESGLPQTSELTKAFENISLTEDKDPTVCCQVDNKSAELCIPNTGVSLKIPEGAIQDSHSIQVTLSLPMHDEDNPPPLDEDHTLITPIVRCKPERLHFQKPIELSLPSNAVSLTDVDMTLWKRVQRKGPWVKVLKNKDAPHPSGEVVLVDEKSNTIRVVLWDFCDKCISGKTNKHLHILVYQNPPTLANINYAYITVFAIPSCYVSIVEADQRSRRGIEISPSRKPFLLMTTNGDLQMNIRGIEPQPGWKPVADEKKLKYESLATHAAAENVQFKFSKEEHAADVETIMGELILTQNGDSETVYFDTNVAPRDVGVGGAIPKRRYQDSCGTGQKRPRTSSSEGPEMISDREINDVALKAHLSHGQLKVIYTELDISSSDVENAQRLADTNDFKLQAIEVLKYWRATKGRKATKEAIIEALEECGWIEAKEILEQKWKHKKR